MLYLVYIVYEWSYVIGKQLVGSAGEETKYIDAAAGIGMAGPILSHKSSTSGRHHDVDLDQTYRGISLLLLASVHINIPNIPEQLYI